MARARPKPPRVEWKAVRDERGCWKLVDEEGREPLRSNDPAERVWAVYLAAAAPALRGALLALTRRMEYLLGSGHVWKPDEALVCAAWGAIIDSKPTRWDWERAEAHDNQLEFDWPSNDADARRSAVAS